MFPGSALFPGLALFPGVLVAFIVSGLYHNKHIFLFMIINISTYSHVYKFYKFYVYKFVDMFIIINL